MAVIHAQITRKSGDVKGADFKVGSKVRASFLSINIKIKITHIVALAWILVS